MKTITVQPKKIIHRLAASGMVAMAVWCNSVQADNFDPTHRPLSGMMEGNLMLALSVEYPTGNQQSYTEPKVNRWWSLYNMRINGDTVEYFDKRYYGLFDSRKCYTYDNHRELFVPTSAQVFEGDYASNQYVGTCRGSEEWSGNLLNFITATNTDQMRQSLTGGARDTFSPLAAQPEGRRIQSNVDRWPKYPNDNRVKWYLRGMPKFEVPNEMTTNPPRLQEQFAACRPFNTMSDNRRLAMLSIVNNHMGCHDRASEGMTEVMKVYTVDEARQRVKEVLQRHPDWQKSGGNYEIWRRNLINRIDNTTIVVNPRRETGLFIENWGYDAKKCGSWPLKELGQCDQYFRVINRQRLDRNNSYYLDQVKAEGQINVQLNDRSDYLKEDLGLGYMTGLTAGFAGLSEGDAKKYQDGYTNTAGQFVRFGTTFDDNGGAPNNPLSQGNRYKLNNISGQIWALADNHGQTGNNIKYYYNISPKLNAAEKKFCQEYMGYSEAECNAIGTEKRAVFWDTGSSVTKTGTEDGYYSGNVTYEGPVRDGHTYDDCVQDHDLFYRIQYEMCINEDKDEAGNRLYGKARRGDLAGETACRKRFYMPSPDDGVYDSVDPEDLPKRWQNDVYAWAEPNGVHPTLGFDTNTYPRRSGHKSYQVANWCDVQRAQMQYTCDKVYMARIMPVGNPLSCPMRCDFEPVLSSDTNGQQRCADGDAPSNAIAPHQGTIHQGKETGTRKGQSVLIRSYSDRWVPGQDITNERATFSADGMYRIWGSGLRNRMYYVKKTPGMPLTMGAEPDIANQKYLDIRTYFKRFRNEPGTMADINKLVNLQYPKVKVEQPVKIFIPSGYGTKMIIFDWPRVSITRHAHPGSGQNGPFTRNELGSSTCAEMMANTKNIKAGYRNKSHWCMNMRVLACQDVDGLGVEEGCVGYGKETKNQTKTSYDYYKPEGLMQQYAPTLRYGATGYILGNGNGYQGREQRYHYYSVLRSPIKYINPANEGKKKRWDPKQKKLITTIDPTLKKEWDGETGVMAENPDTTIADHSKVPSSGVMNYLNKYGFAAGGYRRYDQAANLLETTLSYYRGLSQLPLGLPNNRESWSHPSGWPVAEKDGFPVLYGADYEKGGRYDPIFDNCRQSFVLGIGDMYSHDIAIIRGVDGEIIDPESLETKAMETPSSVAVPNWWHSMQSPKWQNGPRAGWQSGYDFGGRSSEAKKMFQLAYWAKTQDIRPDVTKLYTNNPSDKDKKTVNTYWIDVLENSNNVSRGADESFETITDRAMRKKNQYWMATKYGGFREELLPKDDQDRIIYNPNLNPDSWDMNRDGIPDNYFAGNSPEKLRQSLRDAFNDIAYRATSMSNVRPVAGKPSTTKGQRVSYFAGFEPRYWTGYVLACEEKTDAAGVVNWDERVNLSNCMVENIWNAKDQFNPDNNGHIRTKAADRRIITSWDKTAHVFKNLNDLPEAIRYVLDDRYLCDKNMADTRCGVGQQRLDFIRGDRTYEGMDSKDLFRRRMNPLGDIVNAELVAVDAPRANYHHPDGKLTAEEKDSYREYVMRHIQRSPMLYAAANDGMLHAFSGTTDARSYGQEVFAYIPELAYQLGYKPNGSDDERSPYLPGSTQRLKPGMLNLASKTKFDHRFTVDGTPIVGEYYVGLAGWKTLLIAGVGAGGRGYYALDISNQDQFMGYADSMLKDIVKWQLTDRDDADMGYTLYEAPHEVGTDRFLQISKVKYGESGRWVVLLGNGYGSDNNRSVLYMVDPETGVVINKLVAAGGAGGLSAPTPIDSDGDGLMDVIYAGDLSGKMHRFVYKNDWHHGGIVIDTKEPIVAAPELVNLIDFGSNNQQGQVAVTFGTGKLNELKDFSDTDDRGFYAVFDEPYSETSKVLTKANLAKIELKDATVTLKHRTRENDVMEAPGRQWNAPAMKDKEGWYMPFTNGERVLVNAAIPKNTATVVFTTHNAQEEVCSTESHGYFYAATLYEGKPGTVRFNGRPFSGGLGLSFNGILKTSAFTSIGGSPIDQKIQELEKALADCHSKGNCDNKKQKDLKTQIDKLRKVIGVYTGEQFCLMNPGHEVCQDTSCEQGARLNDGSSIVVDGTNVKGSLCSKGVSIKARISFREIFLNQE